jgi:hypothetical protein
MGKFKEHPRYNIISIRISDRELAELDIMRGNRKRSIILGEALAEKIINDRHSHLNDLIQANGL